MLSSASSVSGEPRLVQPDAAFRSSYVEALREGFRRDQEPACGAQAVRAIEEDFQAYLAARLDQRGDIVLPRGQVVPKVPFSTFWLTQGHTFIGEVNVRHTLNDWFRLEGGHIGYGIRPSWRGRGHGRRILALALVECRRLGLDRVLVTCSDSNVASARVIERNGGLLEDVIPDPWNAGRGPIRRYWIELGRPLDEPPGTEG